VLPTPRQAAGWGGLGERVPSAGLKRREFSEVSIGGGSRSTQLQGGLAAPADAEHCFTAAAAEKSPARLPPSGYSQGGVTESQNHRMVRLEGTSVGHPVQPPAQAGSLAPYLPPAPLRALAQHAPAAGPAGVARPCALVALPKCHCPRRRRDESG